MKINIGRRINIFLYSLPVLFLFFLSTLGPVLAPYNPLETNTSQICFPPDSLHLLGTDEVGRDILSRMLFGARTTIIIGISAVIFSGILGTILGLFGGYYGGKVDLFINQIIDISLAFPSLLLAIGISIVLPPSAFSVITAIGLTGWAGFARLIRSQTFVVKNSEYILAARSLGSKDLKIIFRHILPNCFFLLIVNISLQLGSFMLTESGLSFLGLGVPPPYPTLGGMVSGARDYLFIKPWIPLIPGTLIGVIVLICNILGEKVQDMLNPKG